MTDPVATTIFEDNTQSSNVTDNSAVSTQPTDQPADPQYDFIGEGKKYANINVALDSIPHKDNHISTIEQENAQLRAQLADIKTRSATIDEVLDKLAQTTTNENTGETTSTNSKEDVVTLVKAVIQEEKSQQEQSNNLLSVDNAMKEQYGGKDGAAKAFKEIASALNISNEDAIHMAANQPNAFLKLFGKDNSQQQTTTTQTTEGSVNTQSLNTSGRITQGSYEWYQAQRKTLGDKWYHSATTQAQMIKDADKLGREGFFGN